MLHEASAQPLVPTDPIYINGEGLRCIDANVEHDVLSLVHARGGCVTLDLADRVSCHGLPKKSADLPRTRAGLILKYDWVLSRKSSSACRIRERARSARRINGLHPITVAVSGNKCGVVVSCSSWRRNLRKVAASCALTPLNYIVSQPHITSGSRPT